LDILNTTSHDHLEKKQFMGSYEYGARLGGPSGTNNMLNAHLSLGQNRTWATLVGGEHYHHNVIPAPLKMLLYQWSMLFYLTGMLGVTAVLDLSPPEPVEM